MLLVQSCASLILYYRFAVRSRLGLISISIISISAPLTSIQIPKGVINFSDILLGKGRIYPEFGVLIPLGCCSRLRRAGFSGMQRYRDGHHRISFFMELERENILRAT